MLYQRIQREIIRARKQIRQRQDDLNDLEESLEPSLLKEFQDWDRKHPEIEKYCSNYSDLKLSSRGEILRQLYVKEAGDQVQDQEGQLLELASSPALFLSEAIDLEAQRGRLKEKALLASQGTNKDAVSDWIAAETRFKSSLTRHYAQLPIFAPFLIGVEFTAPPMQSLHTLAARLYFPSEFTEDDRTRFKLEKLGDLESSFRVPLAQEEIVHLRNALGVKALLLREGRQTGKSGLTGNASLTRSQSRLKQAQIRIDQIACRYRHHFTAITELGTSLGIGTEAGALQPLLDTDLVITSTWTQQDIQFISGGRRPTVGASFSTVPWIWKCFGPGLVSKDDTEDEVAAKIQKFNHQAMRVEWLVSRALLERWIEEEKLLREEARRIVAYFRWKEQDLLSLRNENTATPGYKSWVQRERRMWMGMAARAEQTRALTEEKIRSGQW
ncbi:hypothetical protein FRC01_004951 [Tulasnella sp. 417]|nr:hypothetical protein FRC01_004951 [Tulasnella sp. 417]